MKLLSFALPGFRGVDRGWGKISLPAGGDWDVAVGDGKVGCRKPPGPAESEAELMAEDAVRSSCFTGRGEFRRQKGKVRRDVQC